VENPGANRWGWPMLNYFGAQFIASQHHFGGGFVPSMRPWLQFMTRYSRYLWAPDVKIVPEADKIVRLGLSHVPEGREVFPFLSVRENLMTGFAAVSHDKRTIDDEIFSLFPVLGEMMGRRGGDLSGGQQQQLAIARALVTRPKLLVLDEPTEGIQPSIIRDIGNAIRYLRQKGEMAIVVVEQYFEWARDLADDYAVMDRGAVVLAGERKDMVESEVRRRLSV